MNKDKQRCSESILKELIHRFQEGECSSAILKIIEEAINGKMEKEREEYLEENRGDSGNGFYSRNLHILEGKLNLKVPRVRIGKNFRPSILPPPWQRVNKGYEELLLSLLVNGYTKRQIKLSLNGLNLPFQEEHLKDLQERISEGCKDFQKKPLEEEYLAIYIDALRTKVRQEGQIKKITIYTAVGINKECKKEIIGFWISFKEENKEFWINVIEDLYQRGVKRVLVFITDNFPSLQEIIKTIYPTSKHQLCLIHFLRNLKRVLPKEEYKKAKHYVNLIKESIDINEAERYWTTLCDILKDKRFTWVKKHLKEKENYLAFLSFPEVLRKHLYTTNPVESVHSGYRSIEARLGGYFPSMDCLYANLFLQMANLNYTWSKRTLTLSEFFPYTLSTLFAINTLQYNQKEDVQ